jgi:TetR/AcrR family transcriptional regulator
MPWIPATWMREILNEGGLLRTRMLRRLPFDKIRIVGAAIARGQADHKINPTLDPLLTVFSALGLVMLHMATVNVWAEMLGREPLNHDAVERHITGLLMEGLRHSPKPTRKNSRRKP